MLKQIAPAPTRPAGAANRHVVAGECTDRKMFFARSSICSKLLPTHALADEWFSISAKR